MGGRSGSGGRPSSDGSAQVGEIDWALLHAWLWRHTDRRGRLTVSGQKMAKLLEAHFTHVSMVLSRFEEQGRVGRVGTRRNGKYWVADPMLWRWEGKVPTRVRAG